MTEDISVGLSDGLYRIAGIQRHGETPPNDQMNGGARNMSCSLGMVHIWRKAGKYLRINSGHPALDKLEKASHYYVKDGEVVGVGQKL